MACFDGVAIADPLARVRVDVIEQTGRDVLEPEQELRREVPASLDYFVCSMASLGNAGGVHEYYAVRN